MAHILLVEDDLVLQREFAGFLRNNSFQVTATTEYAKISGMIRVPGFDLVLLDINLPGISGYDICSEIRGFSSIPIIFVTSNTSEMEELKGIMMGGDDYITKPFNTAILLARINSVLKRAYPASSSETMKHGNLVLRLDSGMMEHHGSAVELTKNEQKILYYLMKNAGRIVARADIVEYLWDNRLYIDDNALSVHVSRLREKLASIGLPDYIHTKHRQGYRI